MEKFKVVRKVVSTDVVHEDPISVGGLEYEAALRLAIDRAESLAAVLRRSDVAWSMEPHDEGATIFNYEEARFQLLVVPHDVQMTVDS